MIEKAKSQRATLGSVLPTTDWRVRLLDAAIASEDAALAEQALAAIDRATPAREKAEQTVTQQLRAEAQTAKAGWVYVVDISGETVAQRNGVSPVQVPRTTWRYTLDAPATGTTRILFGGGTRYASPSVIEKAMRMIANECGLPDDQMRESVLTLATSKGK
jgi:hypothetical protein